MIKVKCETREALTEMTKLFHEQGYESVGEMKIESDPDYSSSDEEYEHHRVYTKRFFKPGPAEVDLSLVYGKKVSSPLLTDKSKLIFPDSPKKEIPEKITKGFKAPPVDPKLSKTI